MRFQQHVELFQRRRRRCGAWVQQLVGLWWSLGVEQWCRDRWVELVATAHPTRPPTRPPTRKSPTSRRRRDGGAGDGTVATTVTFNNGVFRNDTTGKKIQAHGGGFLKVGDTWYWFGEDKTMNTGGTGNFYAVSCYASKDLFTWEFRNSVVTRNTTSQLNVANRVIEDDPRSSTTSPPSSM